MRRWSAKHGPPPWWLVWLYEEYYWSEKGHLPRGDRAAHDWEYLQALQTIDGALAQAREDKQEQDRKAEERRRRTQGTTRPSGSRARTFAQLNGPNVIPG